MFISGNNQSKSFSTPVPGDFELPSCSGYSELDSLV